MRLVSVIARLGVACASLFVGSFACGSKPGSGVATDAGTAGAGGVEAGACSSARDCPVPPEDCAIATCVDGTCGSSTAPDGTKSRSDTVGDCVTIVCDATDGRRVIPDGSDVFDDANECTDDSCANGSPVNQPSFAGKPCSQGGGAVCDGNGACVECLSNADCSDGVCDRGHCLAPTCFDGEKTGDETDVDCGGSCLGCAVGEDCRVALDCASRACTGDPPRCAPARCDDGVEDGDETDVDCGGSCTACPPTLGCSLDRDCIGGKCSGAVCLATCTDSIRNALETDLDCGGPDCPKCADAKQCLVSSDCVAGVCAGAPLRCSAPGCSDGVQNGDETDVDCGSSCGATCGPGERCAVNGDCKGGVCEKGVCAPTCSDGVVNGTESDVDCGGLCAPCGAGKDCTSCWDCVSALTCDSGSCSAATCPSGFADCDNDYCSNGCETSAACPEGYADCNQDVCTDGCETSLGDDVRNCGTCGKACSVGVSCFRGQCQSLWSKVAGDEFSQLGSALALDSAGNIIVTGSFQGVIDLGTGPLTSVGAQDIFVAKFDLDGKPLWSESFGDVGNQQPQAVAVDGLGNILLAGSNDSVFDMGSAHLVSAGQNDAFVAKLDTDGNPIWARDFGDAQAQLASGITADPAGDVILAGIFAGTIDFGGGLLTSAGNNDVYLAKFDASGTHLESARFGDATDQSVSGVRTDSSGNLTLAGTYTGSIDFGGGPMSSVGGTDLYVVRLDSNFGWKWNESFGDAANQSVQGFALDDQGRVAISGAFAGTLDFGRGPLGPAAGTDAFVAVFDADGTTLGSAGITGTLATGSENARRIAFDGTDHVVVAGQFNDPLNFGTWFGAFDIFVAKFDLAGRFIAGDTYGSVGIDILLGIVVDGSGNPVITGECQGPTINFGSGDLTSAGSFDFFLAKVSR